MIILTFNAADTVPLVIRSCKGLGARIVVVDSYSSDNTISEARNLGAEVLEHPFENYAAQRNWAQETVIGQEDWVLHLDADEVLTETLRNEIAAILSTGSIKETGFMAKRRPYFMGRPIRHGNIGSTWHLRLFNPKLGRCENRLYDQHYIVSGKTRRLRGEILDLQLVSLESWTQSHNRWSGAEAAESLRSKNATEGQLQPSLFGDPRQRKRWLKNVVWKKVPLLIRPGFFFIYSYIFRLGFLDGKVGLIYHFLQSFWFRFLVDAKVIELTSAAEWKKELVDSL